MAMSARAETPPPRAAGAPETRAGWRPSAIQVAIALTVAGAALRFGTLDVQSIWGDEAITIALVHRSFGAMISHLSSSESTPPLYYSLAWVWTRIFGNGPIGFRTLSALAGTITIPLVWACGREVSDRVAGWAAALAVVSPAMYYYSQEARAYGLLIMFCAAAFLFFERAMARRDGRSLAWWGAFSVLALLTHYFAAFLFIPEALILMRRLGWRRLLWPVAAVAVVGIALLPLAIDQRNSGKASWIEESSLVNRVGETGKQFLVGLYSPGQVGTAALSTLLALAAIWLVLTRARDAERDRARDAAIVAAAGVGIPLVLAGGHLIDVFDGRNVIAAWVPFAVLVAIGLGCAGAGRLGAALGAALCAIGLARDRGDEPPARLPARRLARRGAGSARAAAAAGDRRGTVRRLPAVGLPRAAARSAPEHAPRPRNRLPGPAHPSHLRRALGAVCAAAGAARVPARRGSQERSLRGHAIRRGASDRRLGARTAQAERQPEQRTARRSLAPRGPAPGDRGPHTTRRPRPLAATGAVA